MPEAPPPLEATGERLIPEAFAGELVLAEHLARYLLATRLAPGRRVLDAACGEGYGAAMLSAAGAATVVGIDLDAETVAHARERYGLDMRTGDISELPFSDGEFDVVVSFETIEHVSDPHRALSEFARVLGDEGLLLISTPNAREYLEDNPFHVREFASEQFLAALRSRFGEVRALYQQNFLTSAILDASRLGLADHGTRFELDARKVAGVEPGRELYTLALCGPSGLLPLEADLAVLADVYEAHHLAATMRKWQVRSAAAEHIQGEWEARATEAERIQREWEARAVEAEHQNAELRATIDRMAASLSWRFTKPLRALRGRSR